MTFLLCKRVHWRDCGMNADCRPNFLKDNELRFITSVDSSQTRVRLGRVSPLFYCRLTVKRVSPLQIRLESMKLHCSIKTRNVTIKPQEIAHMNINRHSIMASREGERTATSAVRCKLIKDRCIKYRPAIRVVVVV